MVPAFCCLPAVDSGNLQFELRVTRFNSTAAVNPKRVPNCNHASNSEWHIGVTWGMRKYFPITAVISDTDHNFAKSVTSLL